MFLSREESEQIIRRLLHLDRIEEWPEIQEGVTDIRLRDIIMRYHTIAGGSGGPDQRMIMWNAKNNGTELHVWLDDDDYVPMQKDGKGSACVKACTAPPDLTMKRILLFARDFYKIPYPGKISQGTLF